MKFDWDTKKSQTNKEKHGIDFDSATDIWLDENRVEIHAPHPVENRRIIIGQREKKLWAVVFTIRGETIRIMSVRRARERERRRQKFMAMKKLAKNTKEFDRRFDSGEDIHDFIDMSKAKVVHHAKKVRITLDVAETLVKEIDDIRQQIGVDRGALIKIWLHERVQREKQPVPKDPS